MTTYSKIVGTGSYLPAKRVTNHELAAQLAEQGIETSDEWIVTRSGISARHYAEPGQLSSDLALQAAQRALEAAGMQANDIDLIIMATSTPDHLGGFPSTACVVQRKLGITNGAPAMDVQAVCSGFVYAMSVADSFIKSGAHKNVLVIGAEVFSRILDFKDRTTCVLFGDGAGAVIMSASQEPGVLATKLHADGSHGHILCVPGSIDNGAVAGSAYLYMDGPAVFKLAVSLLDKVAREALEAAKMQSTEVDWLVPHQANLRIIEALARRIGLPNAIVARDIVTSGNTSAATIPLALSRMVEAGEIPSGAPVLLLGFGSGLAYAAQVVLAP